MSIRWFKRHELATLVLIILVAFSVRLYRVTNPLLDWHAWRQADTASVTREYLKHGIDPLRPTFLDISSTPSGMDNPNGYRMVEFPLINIGTALVLTLAPSLPLEQSSRVIAIIFSVLGLAALYGLVRAISGRRVATATVLVYGVLPFSMYYSRVVLPEPILVGVMLMSLFAFERWLTLAAKRWYWISFLLLMTAYALKPYAVFFIPVFAALAYIHLSWKMILKPALWLFALATPLPMLWWRWWITQFPEGIPGSSWLFNGNDIRFKPAWVRWIFFERLHRLIAGTLGSILLMANVLQLSRKEGIVYGSWWIGMLTYVTVFATGNVQHDYYQALLIPIVAVTLGRGAVVLYHALSDRKISLIRLCIFGGLLLLLLGYASTFVFGQQASGYFPEKIMFEFIWFGAVSIAIVSLLWWRRTMQIPSSIRLLVLGGLSIGTFLFSWQYVSGYFNVNHWEYRRAGWAVQRIAEPNDLIIAPNMGDTQLLFQTDRRGWPIGGAIDQKITQGAAYYLSTNLDDETNALLEQFAVATQTDEYVLIDLHAPLHIATMSGKLQ